MIAARVEVNGSTAVFTISGKGIYDRTDIFRSWDRGMCDLDYGYTAYVSIYIRNLVN
jgi:hypothetical protein